MNCVKWHRLISGFRRNTTSVAVVLCCLCWMPNVMRYYCSPEPGQENKKSHRVHFIDWLHLDHAFLRPVSPLLLSFSPPNPHNSSSALLGACTLFYLTLEVSILNLFALPRVWHKPQQRRHSLSYRDIKLFYDGGVCVTQNYRRQTESSWHIQCAASGFKCTPRINRAEFSAPCSVGDCVFSAWWAALGAPLYSESSRGRNGRYILQWHLLLLCHPGARSEWAISLQRRCNKYLVKLRNDCVPPPKLKSDKYLMCTPSCSEN